MRSIPSTRIPLFVGTEVAVDDGDVPLPLELAHSALRNDAGLLLDE
jgi:hypothetical protein